MTMSAAPVGKSEPKRLDVKSKIIIILCILFIATILGIYGYTNKDTFPVFAAEQTTTYSEPVSVKNIFVDVDGDGDMDLIISGKVLYNNSPLSLP